MTTADSERLSRFVRMRPWRIVVRAVVTVILAMLLCRSLYVTRAGLFVTGLVPPSFWEWYSSLWERLLGVENSGMAEQLHDAELLGVFVMCLVVCAAVVGSLEWGYLRSRGRRRG